MTTPMAVHVLGPVHYTQISRIKQHFCFFVHSLLFYRGSNLICSGLSETKKNIRAHTCRFQSVISTVYVSEYPPWQLTYPYIAPKRRMQKGAAVHYDHVTVSFLIDFSPLTSTTNVLILLDLQLRMGATLGLACRYKKGFCNVRS